MPISRPAQISNRLDNGGGSVVVSLGGGSVVVSLGGTSTMPPMMSRKPSTSRTTPQPHGHSNARHETSAPDLHLRRMRIAKLYRQVELTSIVVSITLSRPVSRAAP